MAIDKNILKIERPKNTIIRPYGKNKDKYAVKQRIGCKYINGRRLPVTGPTIGHIIDNQYVPIQNNQPNRISFSSIDLKDWGNIILCDTLFKEIYDELKVIYNTSDAIKIYCISILRTCNPGIKDYELKDAYEKSFLSEIYPDVALSKNSVSTFLNDLGKTCSRIATFMKNRTSKVNIDHHLLVDGTLKSNESKVNCLSDYSRKARIKGSRDISVLFAFDLEDMEPVCSKCFPGNMLDVTSYESFISDNNIKKGIIVADKGFPSSAAEKHFLNNPDLHYLNPIKRNSKFIKRYNLYDYDDILPNNSNIMCKKVKCKEANKWLYSFRDVNMASKEEKDWLKRAKANNNYDNNIFLQKQKSFGTLVLESDIELPIDIAYKSYDSRWEIEIVMRFYKSACEFDETRVHDDYSVIGTEFCDFLSTVLTFKLMNKFDSKKILNKLTYKQIMHILNCAKKVKIENQEWQLIKMNPSQIEILQELDLVEKNQSEKKVGRPKKNV